MLDAVVAAMHTQTQVLRFIELDQPFSALQRANAWDVAKFTFASVHVQTDRVRRTLYTVFTFVNKHTFK